MRRGFGRRLGLKDWEESKNFEASRGQNKVPDY